MHAYCTPEHREIIALAHEIAPTMPGRPWSEVCQEAERLQAELQQYADGWDTFADELLCAAYAPGLVEAPQPEPPATIGRTAQQRAADKAVWHLAGGLVIRRIGAAYLVPSGTRGGVIHRVEDGICSCEAGQHGRPCWHVEAAAIEAAAIDAQAQRAA